MYYNYNLQNYFCQLIKTFWSFGSYQVRYYREIEGLNFLINFTYCLTKILPLIDMNFSALAPQETSAHKYALYRIILEEQIFDALSPVPKSTKNKRPIIKVLFSMPLKKTNRNLFFVNWCINHILINNPHIVFYL